MTETLFRIEKLVDVSLVSAVTNGKQTDSEHSRKNDWKLDVHDVASGAEGALCTNDFQFLRYVVENFKKITTNFHAVC